MQRLERVAKKATTANGRGESESLSRPSARHGVSAWYAFHLLGDISGKTVLEYGCGDGPNLVVLSCRGAKVIGLDISSDLLARAKQRIIANQCNGAKLVLGSAHSLPLPDASVDVVTY